MDFSLTDAQIALQKQTKEFALQELGQDLIEKDRVSAVESMDWKQDWDKCAQFGVFAWNMPKQYGGQGMDTVSTILALEALGYGCADNGLTLGINGQLWAAQEPILTFGNQQQKDHYLPQMAKGQCLGAHAMTEPEHGSDSYNITTRAEKTPEGYVLNGHKTYIGLAPACDMAVVFAVTDPSAGQWGISAFLVDADTPGFIRSAPQQKMGLRTSPMGELFFENCHIPDTALLGTEGAGVSVFQHTMVWERSFILCSHVGSMQRQLDECIAYAKKRKAFGKSISQYQSVSNRIANMKLRLETAKLLMYRCASLLDKKTCTASEAAMANLHIAESFVESSMDAIRIHGGKGYLPEYGIERDLRDAMGGVIYSGTSDIQRQVIVRMLGL